MRLLARAALTVVWGAAFCLPPNLITPLRAESTYTERGKTDFDTFMALLSQHGTWEQVAGKGRLYFPKTEGAEGWVPFTRGRWLSTDWGWLWESAEPFAFAVYHYGVCVKIPGKGWAWKPDGRWEGAMVEWRVSGSYYGWRPRPVNKVGESLEDFHETATREDEWFFIERTKMGGEITAADLEKPERHGELLPRSDICTHVMSIPNYREFTRPGPDPEDISQFTGQSMLRRTVLSLPSFDAPLPEKPDAGGVYLYRPSFHQDSEGIRNRVRIWLQRQESGQGVDTEKVKEAMMEDIIKKTAERIREEKKGY